MNNEIMNPTMDSCACFIGLVPTNETETTYKLLTICQLTNRNPLT